MDSSCPFYCCLTPEENLLIQAACETLQNDSQMQSRYRFWGKIQGVANDYYVVQSSIYHPYKIPDVQYSQDGHTWSPLPPLPASLQTIADQPHNFSAPFTGDPASSAAFAGYKFANDTFDQINTEVREDARLAYVIRTIDREGLFPKDFYTLDKTGYVIPNPRYRGMPYDQIKNLRSYVVFIPLNPADVKENGLPGNGDGALPKLMASQPENKTDHPRWKIQDRVYENCVTLFNIHWPGLMCYHSLDRSSFGRYYFGNGQPELHVPFVHGSSLDEKLTIDLGFSPDYDYKQRPDEHEPEVQQELPAGQAGGDRMLTEGEESALEDVTSGNVTDEEDTSRNEPASGMSGEISDVGGETTENDSEA